GATGFLHSTGWMKVFRTARERDRRFEEAERWKLEFGINYRALDAGELSEMEPHVAPVLVGALHWTDPVSVDDPHGLALAYLAAFERLGGKFVQGNAASLEAELKVNGGGWRLRTSQGPLTAGAAVIALGPWADVLTRALRYD